MTTKCGKAFDPPVKNKDLAVKRSHVQYCLFGRLHLVCALKVLVAIGVIAILGLLSLAILYFRKSVFVLSIPVLVTLLTTVGLIKRDQRLIWPIIGISFFHIFLDAYALLIFAFFFFFKPLYIIMVLNWAFDTMYATKTPAYYASCFTIFVFLALFFLLNMFQLKVSLRFQNYLCEAFTTVSSSSEISFESNSSNVSSRAQELHRMSTPPPSKSPHSQCRILNEPPMITKVLKSGSLDSEFDRSIRSSQKNRPPPPY